MLWAIVQHSRRSFLALGAAGLAAARLDCATVLAARRQPPRFKVGVTDWNLRQEARPESFALAKRIGFDGVQVSLASGRGPARQPIGQDVVARYRAESQQHGVPIASTCLNILHTNYLKSDPLGPQRVAEGI